jgi:hypothetical protein
MTPIQSARNATGIVGKIISGYIYITDKVGLTYTVTVGTSTVVQAYNKWYLPSDSCMVLVLPGTYTITVDSEDVWSIQMYVTNIVQQPVIGQGVSAYGFVAISSTPARADDICIACCWLDNGSLSPLYPTNHFFCPDSSVPEQVNSVNIRDFGALQGVDIRPVFQFLGALAGSYNYLRGSVFDIQIPAGTWSISGGPDIGLSWFKLIGESPDTSIISAMISPTDDVVSANMRAAENICFQNIRFIDYGVWTRDVSFKNCKFTETVNLLQFYPYWHLWGFSSYNSPVGIVTYEDCKFTFNKVYIAICAQGTSGLIVKNCTFEGNTATHVVRYNPHDSMTVKPTISWVGNTIKPLSGGSFTGFVTGLFLASSRKNPIVGPVIEGNIVSGCTEEPISLDGFGNNADLVPVICNGTISSVSNDADGRLVVVSTMVDPDGNAYPVSSRTDWTNFYFSLGAGTGHEGTYYPIYSFDAVANSITLDSKIIDTTVSVGEVGVQSGFFNAIIRNNEINNVNSISSSISLWLNVFGSVIEYNKIYGGQYGITLAGGLMLSYMKCMALNNTIRGNVISSCANPLDIESAYTNSLWQYGNTVADNVVYGGIISLDNQKNFTWRDNKVSSGTTFSIDNVLLAADSGQFFNWKSFGAVGDGITDDTAAIQAACDAATAAGGGVAYGPPGIYKVSNTILIGSKCHVEGSGRGATIIRPVSTTYPGKQVNGAWIYTTLAMVAVTDASVKSLTLDHATNSQAADGIGVQPDGQGNVSHNCVIEDNEVLFPPGFHSYLIWSHKGIGTKILHNFCDGGTPTQVVMDQTGIEVYGGSDVLVDGNTVSNVGSSGIIFWTDALGGVLARVRCVNNHVNVALDGFRMYTSSNYSIQDIVISNNHFIASWNAGVFLTSDPGDVVSGLMISNNVVDTAPTGIWLEGAAASTRVNVSNNSVYNSTDANSSGIYISIPNVIVANNSVDTCAGSGIIIQTVSKVDVINNEVTAIQKVGIFYDTIVHGSILGNTVNANGENSTNFGIFIVRSSWINVDNNAFDPVHVLAYPIYINLSDACSIGSGNVIRYTTGGAPQWYFESNCTNPNRFSFTLTGASTSKVLTNSLIHSNSMIRLNQTAGAPLPFTITPGGGSATMAFGTAVGDEAFDCMIL